VQRVSVLRPGTTGQGCAQKKSPGWKAGASSRTDKGGNDNLTRTHRQASRAGGSASAASHRKVLLI
jgi:hypothetical protein